MTTDLVKKGRPTTRRSTKGKRKANSWALAVGEARKKLGIKKFEPVRVGSKLYNTAMEIHKKN